MEQKSRIALGTDILMSVPAPAFFYFATRYNREGVSMKRFSFLLAMLALVLAFGLAFVSCDNDTTSGGNNPGGNNPSGGASTFTLTGIPSQYNGKYAMVVQGITAAGEYFIGTQNVNWSTGVFTLVLISNGRASIPLWTERGFSYTGTETAHVGVGIYNQATGSEFNEALTMITFMNVAFTNGSATKSWSDGSIVSQ